MTGCWVEEYTLSCAAGVGLSAVRSAIAGRDTGLRLDPWPAAGMATWLGACPTEPEAGWPASFAEWESRNNQLAWLALRQDGFLDRIRTVLDTLDPHRVGLICGTSTSSIGRTEEAYRDLNEAGRFHQRYVQPGIHNPHSTAAFLAARLGIDGPVMTIGTACSSSARVFISADRWLSASLVDAVIVAGVDSLCRSTLHGFASLQLVSAEICRPFDHHRSGLNIGEGAGLALLTREPLQSPRARLVGYGETCDAFHMSSPHPEGLGARVAMEQALARAGCRSDEIGYVNLHGTGTRINDKVEALALAAVFPGSPIPASSTKGWTGHTLGAAGIIEAILAMDAMATGLLPGTLNLQEPDPDLAYPVLSGNREQKVDLVLSNSFGFGGNNCVLAFESAS